MDPRRNIILKQQKSHGDIYIGNTHLAHPVRVYTKSLSEYF